MIRLDLTIDNVYVDHGTITTIKQDVDVPAPPEDPDAFEDWQWEHLFPLAGTNRSGDAAYFIRVVSSSEPDVIPAGTVYEFI